MRQTKRGWTNGNSRKMAGCEGRFPQLAHQRMPMNTLCSCATAILPSIWMSMEVKNCEHGSDVGGDGEEHSVRKAPQ